MEDLDNFGDFAELEDEVFEYFEQFDDDNEGYKICEQGINENIYVALQHMHEHERGYIQNAGYELLQAAPSQRIVLYSPCFTINYHNPYNWFIPIYSHVSMLLIKSLLHKKQN